MYSDSMSLVDSTSGAFKMAFPTNLTAPSPGERIHTVINLRASFATARLARPR